MQSIFILLPHGKISGSQQASPHSVAGYLRSFHTSTSCRCCRRRRCPKLSVRAGVCVCVCACACGVSFTCRVDATPQVLYDARTAKAMAERVAEAHLRGSVGKPSCQGSTDFPTRSCPECSVSYRISAQVVLLADVGRPNRSGPRRRRSQTARVYLVTFVAEEAFFSVDCCGCFQVLLHGCQAQGFNVILWHSRRKQCSGFDFPIEGLAVQETAGRKNDYNPSLL